MIDFEKEVTKYGQSLSERGKAKARTVFNELLAQGRTFEWLYYAIQHLNGRSLIDYPKLLFYKEFQEEVDEIMTEAQEKEQEKKERQARICAGIEQQMKQFEERRKNPRIVVICPQPRKPLLKIPTFEEIEQMAEDDPIESAQTIVEEKDVIDKDSKEYLVRRVRGH